MKATIFLPFVFVLVSACSRSQVPVRSNKVSVTGAVNKSMLLRLVNEVRSSGCQCGNAKYASAPEVKWSDQLEMAAQRHSSDMDLNKNLKHIGSDGTNGGVRIKKTGYTWKAYGENIALGQQSEKDVITSWLKSPGHCKNIMNPVFTEIGIARSGNYWTLAIAVR